MRYVNLLAQRFAEGFGVAMPNFFPCIAQYGTFVPTLYIGKKLPRIMVYLEVVLAPKHDCNGKVLGSYSLKLPGLLIFHSTK